MPTGDPKVIELLNDVLSAELAAISQYFLHAEMCQDWGYGRLYQKVRSESLDEMKHAEKVIERILYLNGLPNVRSVGDILIGQTVPEQFEADLALEHRAVARLNDSIKACRDAGDNGTRELLENILEDEEEHTDWLEAQLELIGQVGLENYLAQQIVED